MLSNRALDEIQVTVIYSSIILVAVTSECFLWRVICKTLTGTFETLANSADPDQNGRLIRVCTFPKNLQMVKG